MKPLFLSIVLAIAGAAASGCVVTAGFGHFGQSSVRPHGHYHGGAFITAPVGPPPAGGHRSGNPHGRGGAGFHGHRHGWHGHGWHGRGWR